MTYINLTPHSVRLNDGREFPPSGTVARVATAYSDIVDDVACVVYGDVQGLPAPVEGARYIVSGMVLGALNGARPDVVAPCTGHPAAVRNERGQIVSVPCFVR